MLCVYRVVRSTYRVVQVLFTRFTRENHPISSHFPCLVHRQIGGSTTLYRPPPTTPPGFCSDKLFFSSQLFFPVVRSTESLFANLLFILFIIIYMRSFIVYLNDYYYHHSLFICIFLYIFVPSSTGQRHLILSNVLIR